MYSLIPCPNSITDGTDFFNLTDVSTVVYNQPELMPAAGLLSLYVKQAADINLTHEHGGEGMIFLELINGEKIDDNGLPCEEFELTVTQKKVSLKSATYEGVARAIQFLRQLIDGTKIPEVAIKDKPAVAWRGMHLDVSRYFMEVEDVKDFIDRISMYGMNVFHWHLTDDQGWRIEVKAFPKLTEVASKRECTLIGHGGKYPYKYDNTPHEGFYTQEQIKEVVEYAAVRGVMVIPEIDVPGHVQALLEAYPEYGSFPDSPVKARCHWGISQRILNPRESTVQFVCKIFDEVAALFPAPFFHVGGDEALKREWMESREVMQQMEELGIDSLGGMQKWFIERLVDHLKTLGKTTAGWNEIMEGGIPEDAIITSWKGEEPGIKAAQAGSRVVMAPKDYVYFDYYQQSPEEHADIPLAIFGFTPLKKVYDYNLFPDELTEDQKKLIIGGQGQCWREYMPTTEDVLRMTFPRACALAEVLWCGENRPGFKDFTERLKSHEYAQTGGMK